MKNLIPLTRKISYWDNIVNSMNLVNRTPLQNIRSSVAQRFEVYKRYSLPNTLSQIPASTYIGTLSASLKSCYDSGSIGIELLKQKVRDRQLDVFKGECQYCNMGEPLTIDHYLPRFYFPEFSALSINLIPCCATCNNKKGEEWLVEGSRKIINYYYDELPDTDYLVCKIVFRKGIAKARFSLETRMIGNEMATVIENHFETLGLLDRYNERSGGEITEVLDAITQRVGLKTLLDMRAELVADANDLKNRRGSNYWRAVLKIALANSDRFLRDAGFR
ncbi:hypothetical protein CMT20_06550 [Elizabethkingia anophelis]|nr:hypothetical protein [Elizabethkingia anophelis]